MSQSVRRRESSQLGGLSDESRALLEETGADEAVRAVVSRLASDEGLSEAGKSLANAAATTAVVLAAGAGATGMPVNTLAGLLAEVIGAVALREPKSRHRGGGMAPHEEAAWKSVGAAFGNTEAEVANRVRSQTAYRLLVERSVPGDVQMARILGVDRTRISQRVTERSLFAFDGPNGRCYPRWQIRDGKLLRGLRLVLVALDPTLHPLTVDHWMNARNDELLIGGEPATPIEWLETGGDADHLAALARRL